jgi:broad specificity phosphatase PhoE
MTLRKTFLLTASLASGLSPLVPFRNTIALRPQVLSAMSSSSMNTISGPTIPDVGPTAKRLFLVRHGEVINPGGDKAVYYGAMDVSLSELGEREAQAAGEYLSQFALSKVFSSPLTRAMFGAGEVLNRQAMSSSALDIVILDGFKELDRGDWCGLTKEEIGPALMSRFDACDESVTPANGESFPALNLRVMEAHRIALSQMDPGSAACIVSHLQVTRCIISEALNIPVSEMTNLKVDTASITCIDYDGDTRVVRFQSFKPVGLNESSDRAN